MSNFIPQDHPLAAYHRRRPNLSGRSDEEIFRQWGRAKVLSSLPPAGVVAGSHQTVIVRYTAGSFGLDEDGGLKFAFRFVSDAGKLQTVDPEAENYVTATTTGAGSVEVQVESKGTRRPFQRTVLFHYRKATLAAGETIDIVLGDRSGGSPGWRQQTYYETPFPIRVSVDPLGAHDYHELPRDLGWDIIPGPAARYVLNAPSFASSGEAFEVRVKAEDEWGNPLRDLSAHRPRVLLVAEGVERPLSGEAVHERGVWKLAAAVAKPGNASFRVDDDTPSICNTVTVREAAQAPSFSYNWCDFHGQSGETVGSGTIEEYFQFARHYAFLDGAAHQGNDFQIGLATWEHFKKVTNAAYESARFVTFQGYEWSGTEALGGDHNVLYHEDDPPIYRSSGWLDENPFEETAPLSELYRALRRHRAITIAHVGGRPAALTVSDPAVEPLMEIHSAWGTFEWVYREAFARGFKIGFVCNSDGHKCRPGASYPGAGIFGTLGGLTCVLSKTRDRDGFWEALRSRRCYGTTGQRIVVEAEMNGCPIGSDVETDKATVRTRVAGTSPIVRVDLLRKAEVVQSYSEPGAEVFDTLVIRFGGARVKGRARMVPWRGRVRLEGNQLASASMNGIFSPAYGITRRSEDGLAFDCVTTGNLVNLQLRLSNGLKGTVHFESDQTSFSLRLAELGFEPRPLFEAPLDQRVEAFVCKPARLPLEVVTSFQLDVDHAQEEPYFLRVTQLDEGRAWTSPFYVRGSGAD